MEEGISGCEGPSLDAVVQNAMAGVAGEGLGSPRLLRSVLESLLCGQGGRRVGSGSCCAGLS